MKEESFDLCVYGATASGMLAAISAAERGHSVALVEPSRWLGGMIGGGIRLATDCEHPVDIGGWTRRLLLHERTFQVWNQDGGQADLLRMWHELAQQFNLPIFFEHRLQAVEKEGMRITRLVLEYAPPLEDGTPAPEASRGEALAISASLFIDASYEGDLMGMAGVSYSVGRESCIEYGESLAGVRNVKPFPGVDPYRRKGEPESGLLSLIPDDPVGEEGAASRFMIPFNFRYIRAMQHAQEGTPAPLPSGVDSEHVELMKRVKEAGHLGSVRGNFNRRSLLDGSIPGLQADYPTADWRRRSEIWRTFIQNDRLLAQMSGVKLGLLEEMYPDTKGWPHQLYIRMARRMRGRYVMTQADLGLQTDISDSIGLGYYNVDIYPCRLVVLADGTLATEGETWELLSPGPYPISYRSLTPREEECSNVLVSVCISASHVACASIRMEPTFMIMGESAGIAAALALEGGTSVQEVSSEKLENALRQGGQVLHWGGEGYGPFWFHKPFKAWWEKHPEEYAKRPVQPRKPGVSRGCR